MRRAFALAAGIAALAFVPASASAQDVTVGVIEDDPVDVYDWSIEDVEIEVGQTVRWQFNPRVSPAGPPTAPHDVRIYDGPDTSTATQIANSGLHIPNDPGSPQLFDYTFNDEGSFAFVCSVHPTQMRGVVEVGDGIDPPVGDPELKLQVKPKSKRAKVNKKVSLDALVSNPGEGDGQDYMVCAKASKKLVKIVDGRCMSWASFEAGAEEDAEFDFKPTKKAKGKNVKVTFTATGTDVPTEKATATLKVR